MRLTIPDPQKLINLCIEIQKEWPHLKYGYNLQFDYGSINIVVSKKEKAVYGPFYYKGIWIQAAIKRE